MFLRLLLFALALQTARAVPQIMPAGNTPEFELRDKSVVGLSGLSWWRDDLYWAVSDRQTALLPLHLQVDRATGAILSARIDPPVPLRTKLADFEDIACDPAAGRVFISTEAPPALEAFTFTGKPAGTVSLPKIFRTAQPNLSMEGLTRGASGRLWTANEDTLAADGAVSSRKTGGIVRLQEFDPAGRPLRQFAWRTECCSLRAGGSGTGITALCLLPDNRLLVMERVVAGLSLQVQIFLADFKAATDTAAVPSLRHAAFVPAQKHLLFQRRTGLTNYEGMTPGPLLADGSRSLILLADSGESNTHKFLALKITGK